MLALVLTLLGCWSAGVLLQGWVIWLAMYTKNPLGGTGDDSSKMLCTTRGVRTLRGNDTSKVALGTYSTYVLVSGNSSRLIMSFANSINI